MGKEMITTEVYKHPLTRAKERMGAALDAYMALREKQGIGHVSDEGKELAAAYNSLKAMRRSGAYDGITYG